jgi:hypothetical protein
VDDAVTPEVTLVRPMDAGSVQAEEVTLDRHVPGATLQASARPADRSSTAETQTRWPRIARTGVIRPKDAQQVCCSARELTLVAGIDRASSQRNVFGVPMTERTCGFNSRSLTSVTRASAQADSKSYAVSPCWLMSRPSSSVLLAYPETEGRFDDQIGIGSATCKVPSLPPL